jgi:uncharacterized membrane protein HdeD (DUF308 family)
MDVLAHSWWALALRGLLGIVIGILFLAMPGASVSALVVLFGIWAFVDGVFALGTAIRRRSGFALLEGVLGVVAGLVTLVRPGVTAMVLYTIIAVWAIATGIFRLVAAAEMRGRFSGEVFLLLSGIAAILFGLLMVVLPAVGLLTLGWIVGIFALVSGAHQLVLAYQIRDYGQSPEALP